MWLTLVFHAASRQLPSGMQSCPDRLLSDPKPTFALFNIKPSLPPDIGKSHCNDQFHTSIRGNSLWSGGEEGCFYTHNNSCTLAEDFKLVVASTDKIYAAFFSW